MDYFMWYSKLGVSLRINSESPFWTKIWIRFPQDADYLARLHLDQLVGATVKVGLAET